MKKLALSMIAALAIFSVSCSKSDSASDSNDSNAAKEQVAEKNPKDQLIALCNDGVARIKANPADTEQIMQEIDQKGSKIMEGLSQEEQQKLATDKDLNAAMQALFEAAQAGMIATSDNSDNGDNEEAPEVAEVAEMSETVVE